MINNELAIKIITQDDLFDAGCFDVRACIEVCQKAFADYANGDVIFPEKVSVVFNEKTQDRINCLPAAIVSQKVYGMKWVSVFPENPYKKNLPNLSAVILLSELDSGFPVAFMEGSLCSNLRTAAVSAVAAKYCAKNQCQTIGFIGAGEQAKSHFLALKEVRPEISVCKVASRTHSSEIKFIEDMRKFYPDVNFIPCESNYKQAAFDSDIIVTAISGQEKILQEQWVKKGAFYCHVGGLEDDFAVPKKADKIICDNWEIVKHRTQTISQMYAQGLLSDKDIYANLDELVVGKKVGREKEQEFIYFNSVGMSFVDVALANWMYQKVLKEKSGKDFIMKSRSMFDRDKV